MSAAVHLVRNDEAAIAMAERAGWLAPPMFERIDGKMGVHFRRMVMGWTVFAPAKNTAIGWVLLTPSWDLGDYELSADGGWRVAGARKLFQWLFKDMKQVRVSARIKDGNVRHLRVLKAFGFREEGRRRMTDGDVILLGMLRDECRFMKGADHGRA